MPKHSNRRRNNNQAVRRRTDYLIQREKKVRKEYRKLAVVHGCSTGTTDTGGVQWCAECRSRAEGTVAERLRGRVIKEPRYE